MATAKLISLQVADIVRWFREGSLRINQTFQRHSVWTSAAKTYLVDTLLHDLPIPEIYIRTTVDPDTQEVLREVVDGQQRVRTLVEFADNELRLTSRSEEYAGMTYQDLDEDKQETFLGYTLGVEQLLNASDDDVIDVFERLNSYTVALNAAEKRHAKYQTEFKWAARKAAHEWRGFWEKYGVFTTRQRFRMADDVLMAAVLGVFLEGVTDGGADKLNALYRRQDDETFTEQTHRAVRRRVDATLVFLDEQLGGALHGAFAKHYHMLMLVAAYAHHTYNIPQGNMHRMPPRADLARPGDIIDRLATLERALEEDEPPKRYQRFVTACSASTQRIASRRVRFREFVRAFAARG